MTINPPAHHCNGCPKRWGGMNTSHCGGCHTTFSSPSTFDRHRIRGRCHAPNDLGFTQLKGRPYECFGEPIPEGSTTWWET